MQKKIVYYNYHRILGSVANIDGTIKVPPEAQQVPWMANMESISVYLETAFPWPSLSDTKSHTRFAQFKPRAAVLASILSVKSG